MNFRRKVLILLLTPILLLTKETGMAIVYDKRPTTSPGMEMSERAELVPTSRATIVHENIPWSANHPALASIPTTSGVKVWTGDAAKKRISYLYLKPDEELSDIQNILIDKEGYTEDWYRNPRGRDEQGNIIYDAPTVGVGQVGNFATMNPVEAMREQERRLNIAIGGQTTMNNLNKAEKEALVDAYYRGDMGYYTAPRDWVNLYSAYVNETDQTTKDQRKQLAYDELWDNNEYRRIMSQIQAGTASRFDIGVMNRVRGWMNTLFGDNDPPPNRQAEIDALAQQITNANANNQQQQQRQPQPVMPAR